MIKFTAVMLDEMGACGSQVAEFKELFPNGATPTINNLVTASLEGLDLNWLCNEMLSGPEREKESRHYQNLQEEIDKTNGGLTDETDLVLAIAYLPLFTRKRAKELIDDSWG